MAINGEQEGARGADDSFCRLNGNRDIAVFEARGTTSALEVGRCNQHPDGRQPRPEDLTRVGAAGADRQPQQIDHGIVHVLVGRPRVVHDSLCPGFPCGVDESGPTAAGRGDLVVQVVEQGGGLDIRIKDEPGQPIRPRDPSERPLLMKELLAFRNQRVIELFPQ